MIMVVFVVVVSSLVFVVLPGYHLGGRLPVAQFWAHCEVGQFFWGFLVFSVVIFGCLIVFRFLPGQVIF